MSTHTPNHRTPGWGRSGPGAPGAVVAEQPAEQLAETLSAWMDGEALPAGVDEAALLQWLLHDEQAQAKWQQWQAQADCLQTQSLSDWTEETGASRTRRHTSPVAAVGSVAWSVRLSQQLAQTRVGSAAAHAAQPVAAPLIEQVLPATSGAVSPAVQAAAPDAAATQTTNAAALATRARAEAANDPVWRWKLAAGFASVAAVGITLWSLLGQPTAPMNTPGMNGALLAGRTVQMPDAERPGAAASLAAQDQNQLALAETQVPIQLASTGTPAVADDPYAEALLQAHSQLGDNLLLQDASFTEQDEVF